MRFVLLEEEFVRLDWRSEVEFEGEVQITEGDCCVVMGVGGEVII